MAETNKLSVEKALEKLRGDQPKSKDQQRDEKSDALNEEIKRMRAQRLRLDRNQRKREKQTGVPDSKVGHSASVEVYCVVKADSNPFGQFGGKVAR